MSPAWQSARSVIPAQAGIQPFIEASQLDPGSPLRSVRDDGLDLVVRNGGLDLVVRNGGLDLVVRNGGLDLVVRDDGLIRAPRLLRVTQ